MIWSLRKVARMALLGCAILLARAQVVAAQASVVTRDRELAAYFEANASGESSQPIVQQAASDSLLTDAMEEPLIMLAEPVYDGGSVLQPQPATPGALELTPAEPIGLEPVQITLEPSEPEYLPLTGKLTAECDDDEEELQLQFGDWLGYNSRQNDFTWLAGGADNLGFVSLESFPTLKFGSKAALVTGSSIHFVSGPILTDLPPRLYDLQAALQWRREVPYLKSVLDMRFGAGVFTDFEGSSRKGIRFPGQVVSYTHWHPWFVSVFGVEALDRDDISVLPVGGFVWRVHDDLILEMVFPRPKIEMLLDRGRSVYIMGELGGGTWAIERAGGPAPDGTNDNATYHDLRIAVGTINYSESDTALEFGWAFDRELSYRSGIGNFKPDDVFFLRCRTLY